MRTATHTKPTSPRVASHCEPCKMPRCNLRALWSYSDALSIRYTHAFHARDGRSLALPFFDRPSSVLQTGAGGIGDPSCRLLGASPPSPSPFRYGRFSTISQRFASDNIVRISGESQLGLWGLLIVGDSTDIDTPRWYAGPNTRRWRN